MIKYISTILIFLCAVLFSGCNNDIFLDDSESTDTVSVTLEGDGGEISIPISTKNLLSIDIQYYGSASLTTYYNKKGEIIPNDSPVSEVSRIVYDSGINSFEIIKDGKTLTIKSIYQTDSYERESIIDIEYSYGYKSIKAEFLPGKPLKLIEVNYSEDLFIMPIDHINSFRYGFHNNGHVPQIMPIFPYLNEVASILVEGIGFTLKIPGKDLTIPVPVYVNGKWVIQEREGITPDVKYIYDGPDRNTKIDVEIPPYSSINPLVEVVYTGASNVGKMVFLNEITGKKYTYDFYVKSHYPISHRIYVNEEN
ncbi:MAG: hypothetical protein K2K95_12920 [Muribaculaceae bacterium]|nr:hypothetical protein [Muribaculaceae bacterium]